MKMKLPKPAETDYLRISCLSSNLFKSHPTSGSFLLKESADADDCRMTLVWPSVIKGPSKTATCFDPARSSLPSASKVSGPEFRSKFCLGQILSLLGVGIFVNPIK